MNIINSIMFICFIIIIIYLLMMINKWLY